MNPTAGDVHVNTPLTNISIAYLQNADHFVASKVFPNIPVSKQSDRYYTYERGEFNRDEARIRAASTESAGGSYTIDNTPTYFAPVVSFHKDVDDGVRSNADSVLNPDREATEYVTHKLLINREKTWAANHFVAGKWTTDDTDETWGNYASGTNPIVAMRTAKRTILQSTGVMANTLVLGQSVYDVLADHPDIIERVNAGQTPGGPAEGTIAAMMALFEIPRIFVMRAIENTAKEGQTPVHAFIGAGNALLCHAAPSPGLMTPSAGYTFSWNGYLGAGADGNRISKFRMEHLKSDRVEGEMAFDSKLIAADLGYFFVDPGAAS